MAGFRYSKECIEAIEQWDGILSAPSPQNRKRLDGIRVFESPLIERILGTAHPILPGLWAIPVAIYGLYKTLSLAASSVLATVLVFFVGALLWTLMEYLLHRFPFHMKTDETFESKFRVFMMHGYHHEFPSDRLRLVAPPIMAWPPAAIVAVLYFFVLGDPYWWALFGGTAFGYLCYDWIHYYTHHFRPKTKIGKFLRRYHMEHHFKDQNSHFGISCPLWDLLFGTYSAPTEPTPIEIELIGDIEQQSLGDSASEARA